MFQFLFMAIIDAGEAGVDHLQVGKEQLRINSGNIAHDIDAFFRMENLIIGKGSRCV